MQVVAPEPHAEALTTLTSAAKALGKNLRIELA